MAWFSFLQNYSSTTKSYPLIKRSINKFIPQDDIAPDTWLSVSVADMKITKTLTTALEESDDDSSYVVVYEDAVTDQSYIPVRTVIYGDRLYFQAAENHYRNTVISNTYSLYYMTPNIRYLAEKANGDFIDYYIGDSESSITYFDSNNLEELSYTVDLDSTSYYNFSFINPSTDWSNGSSLRVGSTVYLTFSGPSIKVYGDKSVSGGKAKVEVFLVDRNASPGSLKTYIIDCYSPENKSDQVLLDISDLEYTDYRLSFTVIPESNINSSGNSVSIKYYNFSFDVHASLGKETLRNDVSVLRFGATTTSSSVLPAVSGTDTIINNNYESVDARDVLVKMWMEVY